MDSITIQEFRILRHMLGNANRNYFSADPDHSEMPILRSLESKKMVVCKASPISKDYLFHATEKGIEMVNAFSGKEKIKLNLTTPKPTEGTEG